MSTVLDIFASIIQGSALGPASYVANAADLTTVTPGNAMFKYADDTYIIIPARNSQSRGSELDNVSKWALANNLRLNKAKCVEIVFTDSRRKLQICHPPTIPDIQRVTSVSILGVTISNRLSVSEHVQSIISKCAQSIHALKILGSHGMSSDALKVICKFVVLTKLLYASPAWWCFATLADKQRLEAFLRRGVGLNLYSALDPSVSQRVQDTDDELFSAVMANSHHVLHHMLPDRTSHPYTL